MIRQLPKVESASRMNRAARWDSKQKGGPERVVDYAQGSASESSVFDPQQLLSNAPFGRSEREYSPSETIFLQGEPANAVFYIENGEVKLSVISENGKQAIVDIFGEKTFFGEGCLAGDPIRVVSATALKRSKVIRLEKGALLGLFQRLPKVAEEFMSQLASRNLRMQAEIADHIFNSSEKRLARQLLNLARISNSTGSFGVIPRMSQETLAEMVGTTRPRISFFLNRFRECGFISYERNTIQVHRSLLGVLSRNWSIKR